jgi:ATP-dependent helicase/nuclease subunit B
MSLITTYLSPNLDTKTWVEARVRARLTTLAPTTFIMPTQLSGRALRRGLATVGYANVRTATLREIAAGVGETHLAAQDLNPLPPALEDAAIRSAIQSEAGAFGPSASHPALVQTLRRLFRRFRDVEAAEALLESVAEAGEMARASVASYRQFRQIVKDAHQYDSSDLFDSASEHLTNSSALLAEWGDLALMFPGDLSRPARRFIDALAASREIPLVLSLSASDQVVHHQTSQWSGVFNAATPPPMPHVRLLLASEAAEEVTLVTKEILAGLVGGRRLDRTAIVYRQTDPYARLVRDTLSRAGLPFTGLDGRPLVESIPGKAFLGLLKMRSSNFGRPEVVEWHGYLHHGSARAVAVADWERLSRKAGVVAGAEQWVDRLSRLQEKTRADLEQVSLREEETARRETFLQIRIETTQKMIDRIRDLSARIQPPTESTWDALCTWGKELFGAFVELRSSWDEREQAAHEMVAAEIENLRAAGPVEPSVDVETFLISLTEALEVRTQTEGRLGVGLVVGSLQAVSAMEFDRIYVLGVTEQAFPTPPPADPILPLQEDVDLLGLRARHQALERAHFESVIRSVPEGAATLSCPIWDASVRPVYPSPWLVELLSDSGTTQLNAGEVRDSFHSASSPDVALTPINLAEFRFLQARSEVKSVPLAQTVIAQRQDLPLVRNLATLSARLSTGLTEYDGCLADARDTSPAVRAGLTRSVVSPTSVERWATCPFSYFLEKWIGVEKTELPEDVHDWSLSPLIRGSVIHAILEDFFNELRAEDRFVPGYRYSPQDHERIEGIAQKHFHLLEESGDTGLALAWENETRVLFQDLHTILDRDEEERGAGLVPAFLERAFGFEEPDSWPALQVPLGEGRSVSIRGRIDRVDMQGGASGFQRLRVLDYKTGSSWNKPTEKDPLKAGTKLQLAAYMRAAEGWLDSEGQSAEEIEAAYWYISRKGEFELAGLKMTPELSAEFDRAMTVIDDSMQQGCFPQVPGKDSMRGSRTGWDNCFYCAYNRLCPTARDQLYDRKKDDHVAALHGRLAVPKVES